MQTFDLFHLKSVRKVPFVFLYRRRAVRIHLQLFSLLTDIALKSISTFLFILFMPASFHYLCHIMSLLTFTNLFQLRLIPIL